jgi:tape measure domain-containing protein
MNEEIARLTGTLRFNVESAGFQRFNRMMQNANNQLRQFAQDYGKLSAQMAKGLKLKLDSSQVDKAKTKLDSAIKRQARAEAALSNQQRKTFTTELTQQKLRYAGTKAQNQLNSVALQSQKDAAIVAAKAAASVAAGDAASKAQLATQNALVASVAKQTRLQAIQQKLAANTQKAANNHLMSQGKLQRIQQQMNHAQQQAHIRAQRAATQQAAAAQTATNKTQGSTQSAQRFQWAQQRHQAWQARQNAPAPANGGMFGSGIGGVLALGGAIGGIGIAVSALNGLIGKLGERVEARKESVMDAEAFNSNFTAISRDPAQQKMWREQYIKATNDSGNTVDTDSAKDFRNFVMAQQAYGKKPDDIMKGYKLRQQAFAIGGASREDAKELNKQLGQMSSDGTGAASDANIINDRLPLLAPYLARAYGEEKGIKDVKKARVQLNKDLKSGKGVKYDWYEKAMGYMVEQNQGMLEDRRKTVGFAKAQADNQAFLNTNQVNTDQNLSSAMKDNVKAWQDVNTDLESTRVALKGFDEGLTNAQTSLLRFMFGRNMDGSKKSEGDQMTDRMTTADMPAMFNWFNTPEYEKVDPIGDRSKGFYDNFLDRIFGVTERNSQARKDRDMSLGGQYKLPDLTASGLMPKAGMDKTLNYQLPQGRLPSLADSFKAMQDTVTSNSGMQQNASPSQTFNQPITVTNQIDVTIAGSATEKDAQEFMTKVRSEIGTLEGKIPGLSADAVRNMLGQARAQQAERQ